jgi:hypothetical protein
MGGSAPELPEEFLALKNLMRIHLKQILKLDQHTTKVPMHAVALLVMIAYEALARFTAPPTITRIQTHWLFAKRHRDLYGIDEPIGQRIFDVIRNGLAHVYGSYPIPVEGMGDVRLILCWKDGAPAHMKGVASEVVNGHRELRRLPKGSTGLPEFLCVDCGVLWEDLDALFSEIEKHLLTDAEARTQFQARVRENRDRYRDLLRGSDPELWRALFAARRFEEEA